MIVAAVVCPHPPLLVPEIAPGTADELGDLRQACSQAVQALIAAQPDQIVVVGPSDSHEQYDMSAGGTLAAYGVDVRAGGANLVLPLSLTMGAWLLDRAGWQGSRAYGNGAPDMDGSVGLLVMADLSATRSLQAPGFLDERGAVFDAAIVAALASGACDELSSIDADLGHDLGATGVSALKALGDMTKGADVVAHVRYDSAPLGVGYVVADWVVN